MIRQLCSRGIGRGAGAPRAVEGLERRVLLAGADPDPTFSTDGEFTLSVPTGAATANDAVPLAGGKTLLAGTRGSEMFEFRGDFLLARLTAGGAKDSTFGVGGADGNGVVTTDFGPVEPDDLQWNANALAAAVGADGKITVVGRYTRVASDDEAHLALAAARYNADGTPDATFGSGGSGRVLLPSFFRGEDVVALPGGKSLVLVSGPQGVGLLRLNANGTPDATFGPGGADGDGAVSTLGTATFRTADVSDLAVDPSGRPVIGGNGVEDGDPIGQGFVLRFTSTGSIDTGFGGGDGIVTAPGIEILAVAVRSDSRIIAAGGAGGDDQVGEYAVLRFTAGGSPDTTFGGGDGETRLPFGSGRARDVAVLSDGKILTAGTRRDVVPNANSVSAFFVLARFNADGSPDKGFNYGAATRVTLVNDSDSTGNALAVSADGRALVAGTIDANTFPSASTIAVARYLGTATPPAGAILTIDGTGGNDQITVSQSGSTLTINRNGSTFTRGTAGVGKLRVRGLDGDDRLFIGASVRLPTTLEGGNGHDTLRAGSGPTDLVGGAGDDAADFADRTTRQVFRFDDLGSDGEVGGPRNHDVRNDVEILLGGGDDDAIAADTPGDPAARVFVGNGGNDSLLGAEEGRTVFIGGAGSDVMRGRNRQDLLIGSRTVYDADVPKLRTLLAAWRDTTRTYDQRVARLLAGTGGVQIGAATVPDDLVADELLGESSKDWFVTHAGDDVFDPEAQETVTTL